MMGTAVGNRFVAGALAVRKWLVAPESKMTHLLMVLALISIVFRRIESARA
jgi:hypothetical protein